LYVPFKSKTDLIIASIVSGLESIDELKDWLVSILSPPIVDGGMIETIELLSEFILIVLEK
jgi:hypothetical protein